jgi:hypothetical protein
MPTSLARRAYAHILALALLVTLLGSAGAQDQQKEAERRAQEAEAVRRAQLQLEQARREVEILQLNQLQLRAAQPVAQQVMSDQQFEQWVFQPYTNEAGARQRLESLLAMRIEDIGRACNLTEAQKKKLQLAGRGDINRYFDRYEQIKQKFKALDNNREKLQEIQPDVIPMRTILQSGLFHDDSLLYKSLRNALTDEQFTRYDSAVQEVRAFRHMANIQRAVAILEEGVPLRDVQRQELITLLRKETKPPPRPSQLDFQWTMYQIGRIPETSLKPLFSDTQWKVISRQLEQYRGLGPTLQQNGLLPDGGELPVQPLLMRPRLQ